VEWRRGRWRARSSIFFYMAGWPREPEFHILGKKLAIAVCKAALLQAPFD
jgi:hypothetical protein